MEPRESTDFSDDSFKAQSLLPVVVNTPVLPVHVPALARPAAQPTRSAWRTFSTMVFSLTCFLTVFVAGALALPHIVAHWRNVEARAEADAAYQRRRAELRAEVDAAEEHLQILDKRLDLVSLGFREVVRKVSPCVVNLTSFANHKERGLPEAMDPQTGNPAYILGSGSGVIVESQWILTNNHVVAHANRVQVTFVSGQTVIVEESDIKTDPLTDLAAIHLPPVPPGSLREDGEFKVEFGNSDNVERGDLVLALGHPLGLKHTVTHGIISAKGRLLGPIDTAEVLQTDAPINKGNSGGPLFDHLGRMVGINFAIASETGFSQGIGFAIPSNVAKDVFTQLKSIGEVVRGYVGVELAALPQEQSSKWTKGGAVRVGKVVADHPGSKAGLKPGDAIVAFNGEQLSSANAVRHLRQLIMETKVGQDAQIDIVRDEERQTLTITIGKRPRESKK